MARPSAKKGRGPAAKRGQEATVDVLDTLAGRLAGLGPGTWQASELAAALSKAANGVEDEAVKAHILGNLQQCAQQLADKLAALQQAAAGPPEPSAASAPKRAKRGAKAAAAAAQPADAAADEELPPLLASDAGYRRLVEAAVEGRPDARYTTTELLLARQLPDDALLAAHVRGLQLGAAGDPTAGSPERRAEAAVRGAAAALGVAGALAAEASSAEGALCMFGPAVAQLGDAAEALAGQPAAGAAARALHELACLAARALSAMHAALLQQQQLAAHGGGPGGATACQWRAPLRRSDAAAAEAACAAICTLRVTLRLHGAPDGGGPAPGQQRRWLESLSVAAAADLRLLAPHAAAGQLARLAAQPVNEAQADDRECRRFVALYGAAARLEVAGEREYLSHLAAARKAAVAAERLGEHALAACILEEAAALPASQAFVGWLEEQPPSAIVSAALAASRRGLDALSAHLVRECSERGVQALLAAMQRGGADAPAAGDAAEGAEGALDDLLFFADTQGDATVFGRDWRAGASDSEEGEEGEEGGELGVRLRELPDSD